MKLYILAKDRFTVTCASKTKSGKATYPVLNELEDLGSNKRANVTGLLQLFDLYAKDGWDGLSSEVHHQANKEHKIGEFIKGPIRVFYFEDDAGLVVLCCTDLKKTNKANPKAITKAIKLKKDFLEAKRNGLLEETKES